MWEVSTAAISRKRKMSSIASAVLRVAEAVVLVLVDVSMSLVRRSGCVKVDVSWDFARFTVGFANGCNEGRRKQWGRLGLTGVQEDSQRTAEEGPPPSSMRAWPAEMSRCGSGMNLQVHAQRSPL
jgi:hypothetical protein